ncbi:MAG: tRNA uridine-5-carboxymethylaminomethyl(34) synthesis GTPase MnmE [bacterium]
MNPAPLPTIAAQATPVGESGLAVVRVSGPDALAVTARIFEGGPFRGGALVGAVESYRAVYGILRDPVFESSASEKTSCVIDQVLVLPLLAPHGYTGEDTVEFFCHGGRVVPDLVVRACLAAGAEPAGPGEFTRRAFLNGKLSLDQAEAVADLIHATGELGARAAIRQLQGGLDDQMRGIEHPLLQLLAEIEGSLEFLDDEDVSVPAERAVAVLREAVAGIDRLLDVAPAGRILREGFHVVLAGAPNAGKSSLFNALLGEDRAIVDDEAGTTRDVVAGKRIRRGQAYILHDTAGLRGDAARVELLGIQRTYRTLAEADVILYLTEADAPRDPEPEVRELVNSAQPSIPLITVWTKGDLADAGRRAGPHPAPEAGRGGAAAAILTSSRTGSGLDEVWRALESVAAGYRLDEALSLGVVMNARHQHKLEECRRDLVLLADELEQNHPGGEVTGTMLAAILGRLGEVSGRVFSEQVLEAVFRRFCVGK